MADVPQNSDQQLAFLYKVLDDNQDLIRFIDTKAAFVVALLSAMLGKVLADLGKYFPRGEQPVWRQFLVLFFFGAISAAAFIVARIIFPTGNPTVNTRLLPHVGPHFYLWELIPKGWGRIFSNRAKHSQLAHDHGEYLHAVMASDSATLMHVVAGEVLKVSYIRQIKMERFTWLARVSAVSVILFVFLMAADGTLKRVEKPTPVEIQGPVRVAIPPQGLVLEAPTNRPEGALSKKDGANGKNARGKD